MLYPNVRIAGSRPFRQPSQKPPQPREQSWDNRFHLGRIPEYNAAQDPNVKPHHIKTRKKLMLLPDKPKKIKKAPALSELAKCVSVKGFKKPPVVQNAILTNLTRKLDSLWEQKNIPQPLREIFIKSTEKLQIKDRSTAIVKETDSLKQEKNSTLITMRSIIKREDLLKNFLGFAKTIKIPSNAIKSTSVENLLTLRSQTLIVLENIQNWKKKIYEFDPEYENLCFVWEGENYLKRLMDDFVLLNSTPIIEFLELLPNDPFFIYCQGGVEIPVDGTVMRRIREAEELLRKEGMPEARRVLKAEVKVDTPRKLNECRSSRVFVKEETKELVLKPVQGDIEEQLYQYSLLVPENIQESLGKVENAYNVAMGLRYPAFLWGKIGNETVALVVLNLENQKSMHKRLFISHFSVIQIELIEKLLDLLLTYIWSNYDCVEIRVGIISKVTEQGKYEADKSVKQFFDAKGFRWKQMIYTVNQVPLQLLGLRRTDNSQCSLSGYSVFDDNIEMAYACTVQIMDSEAADNSQLNYCSLVGLTCAIKAIGSCKIQPIDGILKKMKGIPPAFRFRKDNKLENAVKDLQSVNLSDTNLIEDLETSVSCSALGLSWTKYLPSRLNEKSYTKITSGIVKMKSEGKDFYLISTEDPQYSAFVIPGQNKEGLFEYVKNLLKNMTNEGDIEELWIPGFSVEQHTQVRGIIGTCIDDSKVIGRCNEVYKFKVFAALHPLGSVCCVPGDKAVVVDKEFIFVMIHHRVDEELEVPMFVVHVTSDKFL